MYIEFINISLNLVKPAVLIQEVKALTDGRLPVFTLLLAVKALKEEIYSIQTFDELIKFVMKGNNITEDEARQYISDLYFERTSIYN